MKRLISCALASAMILGLSACAPADPDKAQESIQVIAMDTAMIFTAYGKRSTSSVYAAEDRVRALEKLLSRTDPESDVSRINGAPADTPVEVDGETLDVIEAARQWSRETGGAFDFTLAPVSSAWGFAEESGFRVPSRTELEALLSAVGEERISVAQGNRVSHGEGSRIDLGGIAKGYVADVTLGIFQEYGIPRGMVNLGGTVFVLGDRPDGTPWRVGVQDPARVDTADGFVGVLELKDAFAVTSGGYQRFFEEGGKRYHHIIDPATGYPAESGLTSVTVVKDQREGETGNGTMCDALSTALFVMGEEGALNFRRGSGLNFELVLVTEDGRVVVTEGLEERFTFDEESGYVLETVS